MKIRKKVLKKYTVKTSERWERLYTVEAESPSDAIEAVDYGLAEEIEDSFEFVERSDPENWDVMDPDTGEIYWT